MKNILKTTCLTTLLFINSYSAIQGPDYDDVRALGMGNTSTAVTTDRTAVFHNPAGLGLIKDKFQCSISPLVLAIDGIFFDLVQEMVEQGDKLSDLNKVDQDFINMINAHDGNWAGFSYIPEFTVATKYFGFGVYSVLPIGVMIEAGHLIPKLALRAERDIVFNASFGIPIKNGRHAFGASLKYLQRTPLQVEITKYSETFQLFSEISSGPLGIVGDYSNIKHGGSIDVGFMHDLLPGFRFAWNVKDLLGFVDNKYIIPPRLNLGCSYYFPQLEKVKAIKNLIIAFELNNIFGIERTTEKFEHFGKKIHIGTELDLKYFALRLGISQGYPTIGIGLRYGIFKGDYAFSTEELGYYPGQFPNKKHLLSFGVEFGKEKEEIRRTRMSPNSLYNKAKALYSKDQYYDAAILFSRILIEYPHFFKNDLVRLHIAQSQEKLDMQDAAENNYNETLKRHPKSPITPYADLGLLRLAYRKEDTSSVTVNYLKLNQVHVKDSLRHHASYYYGQQLLKTGFYEKAISILGNIPADHSEYVFAQHSMGISYASMNSKEPAAFHLFNASQVKAKNEMEEKIVHRSLVMLGYLFYEESKDSLNSLPKAVTVLRLIPDSSYYYEDALLGLGWCGIAAKQAEDCIKAAHKLREFSKKTVIKAESYLLEAYANILLKKNDKALSLLKEANKLIKAIEHDSVTKTQEEKTRFDFKNSKIKYKNTGAKFNTLLNKKFNRVVKKELDSLRIPQEAQQKKLLDLTREIDEFNRTSFFARSIEQIKNELNWAILKTEKHNDDSEKNQEKIVKEAAQEAQEIDEEMEKIQQELKEISTKSDSTELTDPVEEDNNFNE